MLMFWSSSLAMEFTTTSAEFCRGSLFPRGRIQSVQGRRQEWERSSKGSGSPSSERGRTGRTPVAVVLMGRSILDLKSLGRNTALTSLLNHGCCVLEQKAVLEQKPRPAVLLGWDQHMPRRKQPRHRGSVAQQQGNCKV